MPWTRQQVKYLFSNGSPLSTGQKDKMHRELHANPAMGHMKKGFSKRVAQKVMSARSGKEKK